MMTETQAEEPVARAVEQAPPVEEPAVLARAQTYELVVLAGAERRGGPRRAWEAAAKGVEGGAGWGYFSWVGGFSFNHTSIVPVLTLRLYSGNHVKITKQQNFLIV